jgi:hypothetical protein
MAIVDPERLRATLEGYKTELAIDWARTFPSMLLGPHRDPKKLAEQIRDDVGKLKSLSDAGRLAIREERCARAGITIHGEPCFYIGKTR